jgi:hypothetical protein
VKPSRAQIFVAIAVLSALLTSIFSDATAGEPYRINFADVDGNALSTADGHITVVVLVNKANIDKAHAVGDRVPDFCLVNPMYRMITVLAFEKNHSKPVRALLTSLMRRRVDSEARQLQARYDRLKITRNPRQDVFVVADFDGGITTPLKSQWSAGLFRVFVFGRDGELLKQWNDVPSGEELTGALKQN